MKISKPKDMLVAVMDNPGATTEDFTVSDFNPENTSLYSKDDYKASKYIQDKFKDKNGNFDDLTFDKYYELAEAHFNQMSNVDYINSLDEIDYSPFDVTKPDDGKVFNVSIEFDKDYNPFKQSYSRTGINSIDDSDLSLREIAQQNEIFDVDSNKWVDSVNDKGFLSNLFGKTLVYAQYDEDGTHFDEHLGRKVEHSKGQWKINKDGNIYIETLGDREIYGRQIVNPMDTLTVDGTFINKFDIFDQDSREQSATKTIVKLAAEIAPLLIPGFNVWYAGVNAAIGLASVLPTFYKSFESILIGDKTNSSWANAAEGYMAKFIQKSLTDEGQESMTSFESIAQMTGDIFAQIFEQRAAAGLSKIFVASKSAKLAAKEQELLKGINNKVINGLMTGKITEKDIPKMVSMALSKSPELKALQKTQSQIAKSLSLGYMALTSTSDIYGQALQSGYDRRTAGFAALSAAAGQYGIMMNNRMGDWFLDKTTGYTEGINKALVRKTMKGEMSKIASALENYSVDSKAAKRSLAEVFNGIKSKFNSVFTDYSVIGEALFKNAFIEGVEEVTEEMVLDATKGMIDIMSYLGLTKKKGSFNTIDNIFSAQGAERYIASLLGGVLGGAMFEYHRMRIEPWLDPKVQREDTNKTLTELVGEGHADLLIAEANKQRKYLGNKYLSPIVTTNNEGKENIIPNTEEGKSQADAIADIVINEIQNVDGLMNGEGLVHSNEEIINKAIKDYMVIQELEKTKGDSPFGLEVIMLKDFRDTADELKRVVEDIQNIPDNDSKNSSSLQDLKEREKELRTKIDDIWSGKKAVNYFDQIEFALNTRVNQHFINIDRVTYTKTKYGKDYYSLPKKGLGLTQEALNKEWKEYVDGQDVKKELEMATNAYLEMEKDFNGSIDKYITSGYAKNRKLTFKNLLKVMEMFTVFNTGSKELKEQTITNFLTLAQHHKEQTGKNLLPWNIFQTGIIDIIKNNQLLTTVGTQATYEELSSQTVGEKELTKGDLIEQKLQNIIDSVPQEDLSLNDIAAVFNSDIEAHNEKILSEIETLDDEKDAEKINELSSQLLPVHLKSFEESEEYQKAANELIENKNSFLEEHGLIGQETLFDALEGVDEVLNPIKDATGNILELFKQSELFKLFSEVKEQEIVTDILEGKMNEEDLKKIINDFYTLVTNTIEKRKSYSEVKLPEMSDLYKPQNYVLDAIIKEIKAGNLDAELVKYLETNLINTQLEQIAAEYSWVGTLTSGEIYYIIKDIDASIEEINKEVEKYHTMPMYYQAPKSIMDKYRLSDSESVIDIQEMLLDIKENNPKLMEIINLISNSDKYISNSIYDYIEKFAVSLDDDNKQKISTIMQILKQEELELYKASDVTAYLANGTKTADFKSAINVVEMLQSIVYAMQTTKVTDDDIYGFIQARKNFAKRNKLSSDASTLKTVDSDNAQLMIQDLELLKVKLAFLKNLAKYNFSRNFLEQELTRKKMATILLDSWKQLLEQKVVYKEKPVIPDLTEILNSEKKDEEKLLEIESLFYEYHKDLSVEEKKDLITILSNNYNIKNDSEQLSVINKDIKFLQDIDWINYIATNLIVYSKDFKNKYLAMLKSNFNKAPFYTQEFATKMTYASVIEPELFAHIARENKQDGSVLTDYITFAIGNAGTGKTSVLFKSIIYLLQDANPNLKVWLSAPHKNQVSLLNEGIFSDIDTDKFNISKFNKKDLFKELGIADLMRDVNNEINDILSKDEKKYVTLETENEKHIIKLNEETITFDKVHQDLPNIIFIDEITHFNATELEILNKYIKHAAKFGKQVRILTSGDILQRGAFVSGMSYNIEKLSGIFVPKLTLTVRALNSQQRFNNDSLGGLINEVIVTYREEEDLVKVKQLIGNVILKAHVEEDTITGSLIAENFELEQLKPIIAHLQKDPTKKLGLLVTAEQLKNIESYLEDNKISEKQIKIFTIDNIQGAEVDYMVTATSIMNIGEVTSNLRALYTFTSRAKNGSIVIKDAEIEHVPITNEIESSTEYSRQLTEEEIKETKQEIVKDLTEMLDPDFNLVYPEFVFSDEKTEEEIIPDKNNDLDTIIKNPEVEIEPETTEDPTIDPEQVEKTQYAGYSFYNDLNVKVKWIKDGSVAKIYKNSEENSHLKYGLDFLFEEGKTKAEIPADTFKAIVNDLISLKYSLLGTIDDLSIPSSNTLLKSHIFKSVVIPKNVRTSLVLAKTTYSESFNAPYAKLNDDKNKHLQTGDNYLNLFIKLEYKNITYHVHVATLASLDTVKKVFGVDSWLYKNYTEILKSKSFSKEINPETVKIRTSTWLASQDTEAERIQYKKQQSSKKNDLSTHKKYTLADLAQIPGLKFYDVNKNKITSTAFYDLFPNRLEEFAILYKKTTFGKPISEEKIKELFNKYRGKPYVAVTFIDKIGQGESQVKLILLKSKTTKFSKLKVVKDPEKIKQGANENLFSGSQVLDLLISLGTKRPDLFEALFNTEGMKKDDALEKKDKKLKEFFKRINKTIKQDIIGLLTYETFSQKEQPLRKVLNLIREEIKKGNKDAKKIRENILQEVKFTKFWYSKFWNFLTASKKIKAVINKAHTGLYPALQKYYEDLYLTLDSIENFWKDEKIYYNVVIKPNKGADREAVPYIVDRRASDVDNLYVTLIPEGPRLLVDLKEIINAGQQTGSSSEGDTEEKGTSSEGDTEEKGTSFEGDTEDTEDTEGDTEDTEGDTEEDTSSEEDTESKGKPTLEEFIKSIDPNSWVAAQLDSMMNIFSIDGQVAELIQNNIRANWETFHSFLTYKIKIGNRNVSISELSDEHIEEKSIIESMYEAYNDVTNNNEELTDEDFELLDSHKEIIQTLMFDEILNIPAEADLWC